MFTSQLKCQDNLKRELSPPLNPSILLGYDQLLIQIKGDMAGGFTSYQDKREFSHLRFFLTTQRVFLKFLKSQIANRLTLGISFSF